MLDPYRLTVAEAANRADNGSQQAARKGVTGSDLALTATHKKILKQVIISAPILADDATVTIYAETANATNLKFSGWAANRDKDNSIRFPEGITASTVWTVNVSGSGDDLFVLARYD